MPRDGAIDRRQSIVEAQGALMQRLSDSLICLRGDALTIVDRYLELSGMIHHRNGQRLTSFRKRGQPRSKKWPVAYLCNRLLAGALGKTGAAVPAGALFFGERGHSFLCRNAARLAINSRRAFGPRTNWWRASSLCYQKLHAAMNVPINRACRRRRLWIFHRDPAFRRP